MNTNCRRRIRSTIKRGGTVLTVLLLIVWVGSRFFHAGIFYSDVLCGVGSGTLVVVKPVRPISSKLSLDAGRAMNPWQWWFNTQPVFALPLWLPIVLTATPTFLIWRRDRKMRLLELANCCPKCGYSQTDLPADRACPECGAAVPLHS